MLTKHSMVDRYNSTKCNVVIEIDLANKKVGFICRGIKESLFEKVIIPFLFVFVAYNWGWIYGFTYLVVVILLNKIRKIKADNFSQKIVEMSNNNSSHFNQNLMLVPQNQNFQYPSQSPWSPNEQKITSFESTSFELRQIPPQVYTVLDIFGLKEQIKKEVIEELKEECQIIPIQFLESEKLQLKEPLMVRCVYSPESNIYVVDHFELNIYGEGKDEEEALTDFKLSLEETYLSLKEYKDKLGPSLQKKWQLLSKIIEEK